jgi:uncharacterized oxidoreductase
MSACTVAEGKIRVALNQGVRVPDGCLIDSEGNPTNDPKLFYGDPPGAILPIAGHKGSGLSLIVEVLAGALTGGSCTDPKKGWRVVNGMLSIVIDPQFFDTRSSFSAEVQRYIEFVKSSRTVTKDGEILMPGDVERRNKARRLVAGIELDNVTWEQIHATCEALGVTHRFPAPEPNTSADEGRSVSIPGSAPAPE